MKKNWFLGISLALVLAIVGLCGCATPAQVNLVSQQEGIQVTGEGEAMAVPDIATLRLGIAAQAATVAEAQMQATEAMTKVMDSLIDNGVAENDIQTQYFNIRQVTKWNREREEEVVIGYRVTNKVTAKIRDIDKAGAIIDAVVEAGGDLTRIDGISFSVDESTAYYEEARQKAMADAKVKAEQLAELAGVTLGKPTYISEGIPYPIYPRDYMYETAGAVPETPISPGEMELRLTVQVFYAIPG
ncbi:MAG TPA: SIMPL domain-containing protein [Dehalococcoidia bacterium]|nr:SIMPL domain-containing protein [Dehalococcoidia bacterium]